MDAGAVRNKNRSIFGGIAVFGELCDGIELRVLDLRTGDEFAVNFHFTAVVVPRRHTVPSKRNNGVVFHDDAANLEPLSIAALRGNLCNTHIHLVVFDDIHSIAPMTAVAVSRSEE